MGILNYNGVSINYRCIGDGDDVVLIHGLAANKGFWHLKVLLPLARRFRTTVYDLRGHGYSSMPSSGYSSADMAEDLHNLLEYLGVARAHLVGHSFGGVVALEYTFQHPERVNSLTIADSRIRAFQPFNRAKDLPNWDNARGSLEKIGFFIPEDETEIGLWLLEKLALPEWRSKREKLKGRPLFIPFSSWGGGNRSAEKWLELLRETSAKREVTSLTGLTAESLSAVRCPTLLIYGELSHVMPSFCGLRERLPHCRSEIIPGAGHFFPVTQPEIFANVVGKFLEDLERAERRRYERRFIRLNLELHENSGGCFPASTLDVSRRGFLLACKRQLSVGAELEIIVKANGNTQRIQLEGRVVREENMGKGSESRFGIELVKAEYNYRLWDDFLLVHGPDTYFH